jgi:hypothetical protein
MNSLIILSIHITLQQGYKSELWKATVTYRLTHPGFSSQLTTNLYLYNLVSYKENLKLLLRDRFRGYQITYKGKVV